MVGKGLTLKTRIIIAFVAVVVIHVAFQIPQYLDSRPRFYPEAWEEAMGILREEVGAAAVERGVVAIPKVKVPTWQRAAIAAGEGLTTNYALYPAKTDSVCILRGVRRDSGNEGAALMFQTPPALVWLSDEDAKRIMATASYVHATRGIPESEEWHWPSHYTGAQDSVVCGMRGGYGTQNEVDTPLKEIKARCIKRLLARLRAKGAKAWEDDSRTTAQVARKAFLDAYRRRGGLPSLVTYTSIRLLELHADPGMLELLEKFRAEALAPTPPPTWLSKLRETPTLERVLGSYVPEEPQYLDVTTAIFAARVARCKTPEEKFSLADKAVSLDYRSWRDLAPQLPPGFEERVTSAFLGQDPADSRQSLYMSQYGDLRSIAEAAASGGDGLTRAFGQYYRYKATRDGSHIDRCLAELRDLDASGGLETLARRARAKVDFSKLLSLLAWAYLGDRDLDGIPAFFARLSIVLSPDTRAGFLDAEGADGDTPPEVLSVLALSNDAESAAAFVKALSASEVREAEAPGFYGEETVRAVPTRLLAQKGNPALANALLQHLRTQGSTCGWVTLLTVSNALVAMGDTRLLPELGKALGDPEGREGVIDLRLSELVGDESRWYRNLYGPPELAMSLKSADDPLVFLLDRSADERRLLRSVAVDFLSVRYSEEQLLALLADERLKGLTDIIYGALVELRDRRDVPQSQYEHLVEDSSFY